MDWLDIKEFFKDTFKYIIVIIAVLVIAIYIVGLQQVVGPSMNPNYLDGDIIVVDKISYKFSKIKRGDIISLNYIDSKNLIKRVIGIPGDYIEFKNNELYINDTCMKETYLTNVTNKNFLLKDLGYDKIPDDMYFVVGDNRENSLDSRDLKVGLIKKEQIIGKVRFRIWPLNRIKLER